MTYLTTPEEMAAALYSIACDLDFFDNEETDSALDELTEAIHELIELNNRDLGALTGTLDYIALVTDGGRTA